MKNGRTLIYTCADKVYAHWIPLYCLGMLYHNKEIDIEIGIEGELSDDDRHSVEYLREKYPQSKILIKENFFTCEDDYAIVNGIKCWLHSVRFISTPTLKNEYVYIGDIDIVCMEYDIFSKHIEFMKKEKMCYSNIVRKNSPYGLSGLHFSFYDIHYPLPSFEGIDMMDVDEVILKNLVIKKGIILNESVDWRPIHGVHFSKNRSSVAGDGKSPGWGAEPYKEEWNNFTDSEEYKYIYNNLVGWIKILIEKLDNYYNDDGSEYLENMKPQLEFEKVLSEKISSIFILDENKESNNINNILLATNYSKYDKFIKQNKEIINLLNEFKYK